MRRLEKIPRKKFLKNVKRQNVIVMGDLNVNLKKLRKQRDIEIMEAIESYEVKDIATMF